jgi:hypothetical protein
MALILRISARVLAAVALASVVGCASARDQPAGRPIGSATPKNDMGQAIRQPFQDFNLDRAKIPPILVKTVAAPYAPAGDCPAIAAELADLDGALGPDVDVAVAAKGERAMAADVLTDAVRAGASGWIPARGVVRRLTGAEAHAHAVAVAILAGSVRRGYLKGLAHQTGCPPPPPAPAPPRPQ